MSELLETIIEKIRPATAFGGPRLRRPAVGRLVTMGLLACLAAVPLASALAATTDREYRIGPEDVLEISVWREDSLHREVLVRPDGGISFPLAGDITAAGKTVAELQDEMRGKISRYISDPVVTVSVNKVAGYRIYVLGQVQSPGQFVVGRYVDVLQALTLAGGLTPFASENKIKIVRRDGNKEVVFPFRYADARKGEDLEQNIILRSDDVIVVP